MVSHFESVLCLAKCWCLTIRGVTSRRTFPILFCVFCFSGLLRNKSMPAKVDDTPCNLQTQLGRHPIMHVCEFASCILNRGYAPLLLNGNSCMLDYESQLALFWQQYQVKSHPVYRDHQERLRRCVPIYLHGDEGERAELL